MRSQIISILLAVAVLFSFPFPVVYEKGLAKNVPKWNIGDKWVYEGEGNYSIEETGGSIKIDGKITNLALEVKDIEGGAYTLSLNGYVRANAYVYIEDVLETTVKFSLGKIGGKFIISKNLEIKEVILNLSGIITISLAPVPLPFSAEMSAIFTPAWKIIDFPLMENKEWNTSSSTLLLNVSEDIFEFLENLLQALANFLPQEYIDFFQEIIDMLREFFPIEVDMPVAHMKCEGLREVRVVAGSYTAFLINVEDLFPLYFAETLANFIKVNYSEELYTEEMNADIELVSTNYSPPGAPEAPSKPSGKTRIIKGREYEYSTSAIDPNGSMISYGWDWDGDEIVDEWTAFYPSGEVVSVAHSWDKRGKYEVRVKARNEYGMESKWSEPLIVKTWISLPTDALSRYLYLLLKALVFLE